MPVPGEETGHRFLAELLIQFCGQGKHGCAIENVAVRYAGYWNDWTVSLPNEYYPVEGIQAEGTEDWRIRIPKDGTVRDQMIHDKVWMEAVCLLTGDGVSLSSQLVLVMTRAIEELHGQGKAVSYYIVEKVNRHSVSGKHKAPAIRIAMHTHEGGIEASVLIDMSDQGSVSKTTHAAVVYEGEWPVSHQLSELDSPTGSGGAEGDSGVRWGISLG